MPHSMTYYAPASVGNLSVGFDSLGLAIQPVDGSLLGDLVTVISTGNGCPSLPWTVDGDYAADLPVDPANNVVSQCVDLFQAKLETSLRSGLSIRLTKSLPIGSGLGSSASSIVATMSVINQWFGQPMEPVELLDLMGEVEEGISGERHYDNIASSYFGGLVLCDSIIEPPVQLPWPDCWQIVVAYQDSEVKTRDARQVLPAAYPRNNIVKQNAATGRFVHSLHSGDLRAAARNLVDYIAEPYRMQLLPGFERARSFVLSNGGLAAGISGSGPTMFAIVDDPEKAGYLVSWLKENYAEGGFVKLCQADTVGARKLTGADCEIPQH